MKRYLKWQRGHRQLPDDLSVQIHFVQIPIRKRQRIPRRHHRYHQPIRLCHHRTLLKQPIHIFPDPDLRKQLRRHRHHHQRQTLPIRRPIMTPSQQVKMAAQTHPGTLFPSTAQLKIQTTLPDKHRLRNCIRPNLYLDKIDTTGKRGNHELLRLSFPAQHIRPSIQHFPLNIKNPHRHPLTPRD